MKILIIVALALAGMVPASVHSQASASDLLSLEGSGGRASLLKVMPAATPKCRARTHDLRAPEDSVPSGCQLSFNRGDAYMHDGLYQQSYDTLKAAVQNCPTFPDAPGAFGTMANDVQNKGDGPIPQSLPDFQHWLILALAWNPGNSDYFCADVHAMMGTVATGNIDTSWQQMNNEANRGMSVLYWLLHNSSCWNASDAELYVNSRGSQKETWFNTQDTSKVKLDTTIYTMQQLGLDSVLKYAALLSVNEGTESIVSNASAYPNPTGAGTIISFSTNREAYVTLQIFNLLGVQVSSAPNFESVIEPGNHQVPMSLAGLPSGTYYARIMTTYGEVQTVKIVKE